MKNSVVIVDDHVSVREMLSVMLAREGAYAVAGEAGTGFEALKICRRVKPCVVILDLILPEMNGAELVQRLRVEMRETRLLVYSGALNREMILAALRARPHGFVHKHDSLETFREALRAVTRGCSYFTPFATRLLDEAGPGRDGAHQLTDREREVLQMIAEGMSNKVMADRLAVSPKTVEHHRAHLMQKLDLHDVARLTRYAMRLGMVEC